MPETTIHRQLKSLYAPDESDCEVQLDGFRIDAVEGDKLIEIQCAGLSAIRDKIRKLVKSHEVLVVKPLAARKLLVKRDRKRGKITSKRYSPKSEGVYDIFLELVHFVNVFPHPNLTMEILLTEQEEYRLPRLKKGRWSRKKFRVEDRKLVTITERHIIHDNTDLLALIPKNLAEPFDTAALAKSVDIPRWLAQKMAYCLRKTGAIQQVGKQGNAIMYARVAPAKAKKKAAKKKPVKKRVKAASVKKAA